MLQANLGRLQELNTQVLGISIDTVFAHIVFAERLGGLDFPLLADFHPKGKVIQDFGLWNEKIGASRRAVIIVDEMGIVRYSEVIPKGPPDLENVIRVLETL